MPANASGRNELLEIMGKFLTVSDSTKDCDGAKDLYKEQNQRDFD